MSSDDENDADGPVVLFMCVWVSLSVKVCLLFSCHLFVPLLFLEISCMIFVTFYFNFWFFPWHCCRFCFDGLGWKWTLSGWPRNVEKLTKVFPFADSMITWALVLDLHLLQNSRCCVIWTKNSPLWNKAKTQLISCSWSHTWVKYQF